MKTHKTPKKGFTLIEMLVVIAIIALLAAILVPAVTNALGRAQRMTLAASGGGIYKQIFAAATESTGGGLNFWADEDADEYANNSTAYFEWLMTDIEDDGAEVLDEDFSVFNAPGMDPVSRLADFDADANPWSVTSGLNETSKSGMPFLVTRNLNESVLVDWDADDTARLENVGTGTYEAPYGEEALIVIRSGGASVDLNRRQFLWRIFNPTSDDNPIMEPGS